MNEIKCKSVDITDELLNKLNGFTRRKHTSDEVYIFSVVLCDNEVDRDGERFSHTALNKISELFVGKTGVFDHNPSSANQTARIFDCECIEDAAKKTSFGENYTYVKALAYMIKTEKNTDLIREIEGGIKKEVSVSLSVAKQTCSICGADLKTEACEHRKGKTYMGKVCCAVLDEPTDAYEWSFVAVPAQRNAGVTKAHTAGNLTAKQKVLSAQKGLSLTADEVREIAKTIEELENQSGWAKTYRAELEKEVIRLAYITSPYVPSNLISDSVKGLDTKRLVSLRDAYKSQANDMTAQIQSVQKLKNNDNDSFKL